jgi:glycosyltransferase involved in cell wall biosynthesis
MNVKPHIVIDARLYGPKDTGLGRYTKNLLVALTVLPNFSKYKFTLIIYPEKLTEIKSDLKDNFTYIPTRFRHYSLAEQLQLPSLLKSLEPDLVHFTHLDKPIFYFGKSVVTIHDLIKHFYRGQETTTKNPLFYWPKYFAYLLMTQVILKTSSIIVPSNFWRDYIIKKFNYNPQNIITTYEAVDPNFFSSDKIIKNPQPYVLYTGNLYPHKNIKIIFSALKFLPDIKLKIICSRNVFTDRIIKTINQLHLQNQVEMLGFVPDQEFKKLYSDALALVHPSLLEGFSLTGLEAMALNCPVIAAETSCLPEIYQNSVLYFDPHNTADLVSQIKKLIDNPQLRQLLIKEGHTQVKKYSWSKTAALTLEFYEKFLQT